MQLLIFDAVTVESAAAAAAIRLCECSYLLLCMLLPDAVTADNAAPAAVKAAAATRWCKRNCLLFLLLHDMYVLLEVATSMA